MTWWMSAWAGLAVLCFAMVFSVPRRTLPWVVSIAIVAHLTRSACLELGVVLPMASFAAAILVGLTAAILAPRTQEAIPIYAFAPVIPLIPGTYMFDALSGVLDLTAGGGPGSAAVVAAVVVDTSIATVTIIALAVGAIGPTLLVGRHLARLGGAGRSSSTQT